MHDEVRDQFELYWREKFSFEIKRGDGRSGHSLKMVGDKYLADKTQFAYEIWCDAMDSKNV